ncbi:MAG TPA: hypothetical protein VMU10_10655 [Desulfomonilia bacterium]|nr:hypothetical protein [Desulfomonilia bacterium]
MSSVTDISNALLAGSLLNSRQTGSPQTTNDQMQTPVSGVTDTVSLSNKVKLMENEALLNAESKASSGSDSSIFDLLAGNNGTADSSGSLYNLLLSAENAQLMQANPALVKDIVSREQAKTAGDTTSSSSAQAGSQILQDLENMDLLTMSPDTLASIIQKYTGSTDTTTQALPGSQINETV